MKIIAHMIRLFHACLWLFLFIGVLFSHKIHIIYMCTFIMVLAIMLWNLFGYCFLNVLENTFDPLPATTGEHTSFVLYVVSKRFNIDVRYFTQAFNYMIYIILFIGIIRIHHFILHTTPNKV